jgi:uncharacterized membrane protein YeaQ/YmgE (transglycosylase-associated protein family)
MVSDQGPFGVLAIGLIAGWIAQRVVDRRLRLWNCLLLGALGAVSGASLSRLFGLAFSGVLGSLALSTIGSTFLLAAYVLLRRGR